MLHLVIGTMKSSKTKTLIDYTSFLKEKRFKVFYPASCNKLEGYVYTRFNEQKFKAYKVFEVKDIYNQIVDIDCVIIDEFQFLTGENGLDEFMSLLEFCDKEGKDVYLFGLSLDYMSLPFNVTQRVLPYADSVIVLHANCDICGKPAFRCLRYIDGELDVNPDSDTLVMESMNVEYKSVCKNCYREITGLNAIK